MIFETRRRQAFAGRPGAYHPFFDIPAPREHGVSTERALAPPLQTPETDRTCYSPPMAGPSSTSQETRMSGASEAATEQYLSKESCTARSTCSRGESVETR
jgi:hypothetical protein